VKPYQEFIIVTDIDGTLANSQHRVSAKNKKAIAHFVEQGGHFAVATGRTQKNVVPYMNGLAINTPCILYNGGALFSWQEQCFIKTKHMESSELADYLSHCIAIFPKMCVEVFTQEQLYVITDPTNIDEHMEREKQEFVYAGLKDILGKVWLKVILCDRHDNLVACREILSQFGLNSKTNNFFSAATYLEIVDKQVSKGNMLDELLRIPAYMGKKVIAAGDFQNDIEML
jgi:Cof subfamily protein (haloacid dehalogenase superfamily)